MQHNANQYRACRWTVMLAAAAGVTFLMTACSGSSTTTNAADPGSSRSISSAYAKALAYSQCIRAHGVPNFPDPTINNGGISIGIGSNQNINQSALQAAQNDCKSLNPVHPLTGAQEAQNAAESLKWAACMRQHGEPNFPDPTNGTFDLPASISPRSATFQAAQNACQKVRPMQISMSGANRSPSS